MFVLGMLGYAGWLLLVWLGMREACGTYFVTPDSSQYFKYVFEGGGIGATDGGLSKAEFLFGGPIAALLGGMVGLLLSPTWIERHKGGRALYLAPRLNRAVIIALWAAGMIFASHTRSEHALSATAAIAWTGTVAPNPVVQNVCHVAGSFRGHNT
jgi:hypothetical protein